MGEGIDWRLHRAVGLSDLASLLATGFSFPDGKLAQALSNGAFLDDWRASIVDACGGESAGDVHLSSRCAAAFAETDEGLLRREVQPPFPGAWRRCADLALRESFFASYGGRPRGSVAVPNPHFDGRRALHGSSGRGHRRPASRARRQRVPRVGVPSVFARVYRRGASGWKRRRREGMARPSVLVCQRSCFEVASCFYAKSGGFQPFGRISCLCPFGCALFRRTGDRNGSRYWNCEPCVLQGVIA